MTLIPAIRWFQTCKAETFINNSAMKRYFGWFNEALIIFYIIYTNVGIKHWVINY